MLCSSSGFFKTRSKPEWEREGAAIKLPDHSSRAFDLYANWLYKRKIPSIPAAANSSAEHEIEFATLAAAYALGEALIDTTFKDTVIDALRAKVRSASGTRLWIVGGEAIKVIYEGTPEASAARTFLVDVYASLASDKDMANTFDKAPKDFYYDVAIALKKRASTEFMAQFGGVQPVPCRYHCHVKGERCYLEQQ